MNHPCVHISMVPLDSNNTDLPCRKKWDKIHLGKKSTILKKNPEFKGLLFRLFKFKVNSCWGRVDIELRIGPFNIADFELDEVSFSVSALKSGSFTSSCQRGLILYPKQTGWLIASGADEIGDDRTAHPPTAEVNWNKKKKR